MLHTIGNTPGTWLKRVAPSDCAEIWVKLEGVNPTGSYKDRVSLAMLEGISRRRDLTPGKRVLECTGGSTGTSVAFVGAVMDLPITIISSNAYAKSKLDSIRAFGAELIIEESPSGEVTSDLWPRMRARAMKLVEAGSHIWLDQFNNPDMLDAYRCMGHEIVDQIEKPIDAFCGCVGTAGMVVGVGGVVRDAYPDARVVALEPESSAVLSGRSPGSHTIDGTAAGFVPPLFDDNIVTEVLALPEGDGRKMARRLAQEEGIFAGTSSGMNVLAAIQIAREIGPGGVVATVACDTGFKYLHETLFDPPK